jgi:hypothetical protein
MRGEGRTFQRGSRWWIAYNVNGKEHREPGGKSEAEARRKLKARWKEIHGDRFIAPQEQRVTVGELLDALLTHLENKGAKAVSSCALT